MNFRYLTLLLAGLLIYGAVHAEQPGSPEARILIGGTGGALGTLQLLGQAFKKSHPQARIVIVPSLGSSGGIKALRAGALDLAVISRPLKDSERSPDAIAVEYARTPFVFATAVRTHVAPLTTPELVRIYSGELKTWPDGSALRLVLRSESESDTDTLKSLSPEMRQAVKAALSREGMNIAPTDKASADSLEKIPGALGTSTLAQIISENRALQALALNGITPSINTLAQGKYPYCKTFFMVSSPRSSPLTQQFIVFMRSAVGQGILEQNGHWVTPAK